MPQINVTVNDQLYRALKDQIRACGMSTWGSFFAKVARGEGEVLVDFLSIDGHPPKGHTVVFKLGDYLYRYRDGDYEVMSSPVDPDMVRAAARGLAMAMMST